jgi:hypothetical protein
MHSLISRY